MIDRNLHVIKVTAWIALSAQGVIGPFGSVTKTGQRRLLQLIEI